MDKEIKAVGLTDEDMAKVAGGGGNSVSSFCPNCNAFLGMWFTFNPRQYSDVLNKKVKCTECNWEGFVSDSNLS